METICRLCAKERPIKQLRRSFDDRALNIQQKLIDCCRWKSLFPIEYDTLPRRICSACYQKLESSWLFAENVAKAQEQLISQFAEEKPVLPPIEHVSIPSEVVKSEPTDFAGDESDEQNESVEHKQQNVPVILNKTEAPEDPHNSNETHIQIDEHLLVKLNLPDSNLNFTDDHDDELPLLENDLDIFDGAANDSKSESSSNEENDIDPLPIKPRKRRYDARNIDYDEIQRKRLQKIPGSSSQLCDTCGRVCSNTTSLRRHVATHTNPIQITKPLECKTCGKRFRDNHSLRTHENTHTGAKPYSCGECDYRSAQQQNISKHYKQKHGIKKPAPRRMWVRASELTNTNENDGPTSSHNDD